MMNPQLPLDISLPSYAVFSNYIAGENQELFSRLRELSQNAEYAQDRHLFLWGEQAVGKSHLLQATCSAAHRSGMNATYLPLKDLIHYSADVLDGMESLPLVCIDDVQLIAGHSDWEVALFNLINLSRQNKHVLLMAATDSPGALGIELPDLKSRLSWGLVHQVIGLDEQSLPEWIQDFCQRQGLDMPEQVASFIVTRYQRDMHSLVELMKSLNHASMVAQKKLTLPFVKQVLAQRAE